VTVPRIRRGDQRLPDVNVFNWRVGYKTTFRDRYRVEPSMDLYNVFNKNQITGMVSDIGPSFQRPQTILGQRFAKFGVRIEF
jgi:hypothetical protein